MVWKESKELGVGRARSKSGKIMVVANYGNYELLLNLLDDTFTHKTS